jgi:hypothetical protein
MVIRLVIDFWELVKVALKAGRGGKMIGEWGKMCGGFWVLWLLCVFGFIFVVVVEGACVRECRDLGSYTVGTVG